MASTPEERRSFVQAITRDDSAWVRRLLAGHRERTLDLLTRRLTDTDGAEDGEEGGGCVAFVLALKHGHLQLARSLAALRPLDVEGDIIVDSARGDTVLHTLQHAHCIEFLCDASLFPGLKDRPNHHGETPLVTQARACHVGAVMALLKHGANPLANDRRPSVEVGEDRTDRDAHLGTINKLRRVLMEAEKAQAFRTEHVGWRAPISRLNTVTPPQDGWLSEDDEIEVEEDEGKGREAVNYGSTLEEDAETLRHFVPFLEAVRDGDDATRDRLCALYPCLVLLGNRNIAGDIGSTALMVAAVMGHVSCVAWLLDKGADPYATDGRGYTAAIRALRQPCGETLAIITLLQEASAGMRLREARSGPLGGVLFYHHARQGQADEAVEGEGQSTSLMLAASAARPDLVRYILTVANLDGAQDANNLGSPMSGGPRSPVPDNARSPVSGNVRGVSGTVRRRLGYLRAADRQGHNALARALRATATSTAAEEQSTLTERVAEIALMLVQAEAKLCSLLGPKEGGGVSGRADLSLLERSDAKGRTPIMHAVKGGHIQVVRWLLEQRCDRVFDFDAAGVSVFSAAMKCRDESVTRQVMQLLAAACTQLPRMTGHLETPLMTAARLGRMSMLGFLLENENIQAALPLLPSCTDRNGRNVLHHLVECRCLAPAQWQQCWRMVATEALVRGKDNEGATPAVHAARTRNYRNLLALLDCGHPALSPPEDLVHARDAQDNLLLHELLAHCHYGPQFDTDEAGIHFDPLLQVVEYVMERLGLPSAELRNRQGVSLLMLAAQAGQTAVLQLMLRKLWPPDYAWWAEHDEQGRDVFAYAALAMVDRPNEGLRMPQGAGGRRPSVREAAACAQEVERTKTVVLDVLEMAFRMYTQNGLPQPPALVQLPPAPVADGEPLGEQVDSNNAPKEGTADALVAHPGSDDVAWAAFQDLQGLKDCLNKLKIKAVEDERCGLEGSAEDDFDSGAGASIMSLLERYLEPSSLLYDNALQCAIAEITAMHGGATDVAAGLSGIGHMLTLDRLLRVKPDLEMLLRRRYGTAPHALFRDLGAAPESKWFSVAVGQDNDPVMKLKAGYPPMRSWLNAPHTAHTQEHFRVMTYSLLPARAATPERFAHADPQNLDWVKRRETFLREVSHWAPSVLCLQRVANDAWPLIADQLRRRGYEGQLLMDQRDISASSLGVAMCWVASEWVCEALVNVNMAEEAQRHCHPATKQEFAAAREVGVVAVLRSKHTLPPISFIAATADLSGNRKFTPVQALSMLSSIYELQQRYRGLPVVWAGDFRSAPNDPVLRMLRKGIWGNNEQRRWWELCTGVSSAAKGQHENRLPMPELFRHAFITQQTQDGVDRDLVFDPSVVLQSAYSAVQKLVKQRHTVLSEEDEPPEVPLTWAAVETSVPGRAATQALPMNLARACSPTNQTKAPSKVRLGTSDFILFNGLSVIKVLDVPPALCEAIQSGGLPTAALPSDHLCLVAGFRVDGYGTTDPLQSPHPVAADMGLYYNNQTGGQANRSLMEVLPTTARLPYKPYIVNLMVEGKPIAVVSANLTQCMVTQRGGQQQQRGRHGGRGGQGIDIDATTENFKQLAQDMSQANARVICLQCGPRLGTEAEKRLRDAFKAANYHTKDTAAEPGIESVKVLCSRGGGYRGRGYNQGYMDQATDSSLFVFIHNDVGLNFKDVTVDKYAYLEQMIGTSFMYRRGSRFPQNRQRQYMQPSQEDDEGFYQYHCRNRFQAVEFYSAGDDQDKVPVLTLFNLNGPDNFAHLDRALLNGAQLMGGFHRYGHQLGHQEVMRQEQDEKFGEEMLEMVYQAPSSAVLVGETHVRNQAYHVLPQPLDRIAVQYFNDSDVAMYRDNPTPQLCRQFLQRLCERNVRLLALSLNDTVLRGHLASTDDFDAKRVAVFVRPLFRTLIIENFKRNEDPSRGPPIFLAIVSLSSNWPLIMSVMREAVGDRITQQMIIVTNPILTRVDSLNKSAHVNLAISVLRDQRGIEIDRSEVLLIDSELPVAQMSEVNGVRSLHFNAERGADVFNDFDPRK